MPFPQFRLWSLTAILFSISVTAAAPSCSTFTPTANYSSYYPADHAYRITNGFTCANGNSLGSTSFNSCTSPNCSVSPPNEILTVTGFTNLSVTAADTQSLFTTVASSLRHSFPFSAKAATGADGSYCLKPGMSSYVTFAPLGTCFNGTFSGCAAGSSIANDTPVMLCSPTLSPIATSGGNVLGGEFGIVMITEAEAGNLTTLPSYVTAASMGTPSKGGSWWLVGASSVVFLVFVLA